MQELHTKYSDEMNQTYLAWVNHMTTLSTGALVLLVSMYGKFGGTTPSAVWLMKTCWISLSISIASGALIAYSQVVLKKALFVASTRLREKPEIVRLPPVWLKLLACMQTIHPLSLAIALSSLSTFAVVNT